jgi:alpha-L-glutamate ligase-like protein
MSGNGIVVIVGREHGDYRKTSGTTLSAPAIRQHVSSTLSGVFSLRGDIDSCVIEERLVLHPAFADLALYGIPDVRIIVYRGIPIMAMCRLPTRESDGRANLHQGAIGVGLALATGRSVHAACWNESITRHTDTGAPLVGVRVPYWDDVLALAARAAEISGLGYQGVDVIIDAVRGPVLLELNARPGLAIQIANNEGLLPRLNRADRIPAAELTTWHDRLRVARELF